VGTRSLFGINIRRSVITGRIYLIIATALAVLTSTLVLVEVPGQSAILNSLLPTDLPLFAVIGSTGALLVFVSDKMKGVHEYLIAYGIETTSIFASIVVAAMVLVSIVVGATLAVVGGTIAVQTGTLPGALLRQVAVYSLPLAYTGTAFMTMAGMAWSSLATPRMGVNGPAGIAPLLGIGPVLIVTILSSLVGPGWLPWLVGGVSLALLGMVALLIGLLSRSKGRERFLSML